MRSLFHQTASGEREFFAPLVAHLGFAAATTETKGWAGHNRAFVGLHDRSQYERARDESAKSRRRVTIALVEVCEHWTADYLHNHGSRCAETLGWASYVLAPDGLAQRLRGGVLETPTRYAEHLDELAIALRDRVDRRAARYVETPWPQAAAVGERADRLLKLARWLRANPTAWPEDRVISSGIPPLASRFFDGARLRAGRRDAAMRSPEAGSVVFIEQRSHDCAVRDVVATAAAAHGLTFWSLPAPAPGESDADRDRQIGDACARLADATVVATEFSNLGYQVALHGSRVLYCSWRAVTKAMPVMLPGTFQHVREAAAAADVEPLLGAALANRWAAAAGPIQTTSPADIIGRVVGAIERRRG